MCPACITNTVLIVAGAISTGGLATFTRLKFRVPTGASVQEAVNHEPLNHEPLNQEPLNQEPTNHQLTNPNGEEQNEPKNRVTN